MTLVDVTETQLRSIEAKLGQIVEMLGGASTPEVTAAAAPIDINMLLHQGRGALLRQLPQAVDVFLSAGCAGRWFFDWVESCCGPMRCHIGLEFYMPRPADLPPNVQWIQNTCSDMSGVANASCDVIFSGQNLEHLWPDEVVGFFTEAARVAKPGGLLAIDSPNRVITAAMRTWSHPEHMIEFTVQEAAELLQLAGFDVSARRGVWLSRDPMTMALLPHVPSDGDPISLTERLIVGAARPEDAFIWWIEGIRGRSQPDQAGLRRRVEEIFRIAWPERTRRMTVGAGLLEEHADGEWVRFQPDGTLTPVVYGPYMPLPAGAYTCHIHLEGGVTDALSQVQCDVYLSRSQRTVAIKQVEFGFGRTVVDLEFTLDQLEFGVEFRCFGAAGAEFSCRRVIDFVDLRKDGGVDLSACYPLLAAEED